MLDILFDGHRPHPARKQSAVQPWERESREPEKAYAAFVVYLDTEPEKRTIRTLAQTIKTPVRTVQKWAKAWRWRERVLTWDREVERLRRRRHLAQLGAMGERHASLGASLQEKAEKALGKVTEDTLAKDPALALSVARTGAEIERKARLGVVEADTKAKEADDLETRPGLRLILGLRSKRTTEDGVEETIVLGIDTGSDGAGRGEHDDG